MTRDRSALSPAQANREIYQLLKNGVKVTSTKTLTPTLSQRERENSSNEEEEEIVETVRGIDWNEPSNNDFFLVSQFWVSGEMYKRRADLAGFVNGLPLVFVELKTSHKRLEHAYQHDLRDYKNTIPHLFWHNAFIILSNGSQSPIGSTTAAWEHFAEWKKINSEGEEGIVSLETIIRGTCDHRRLLDLVENFILFSEAKGGLVKLVAKNHQSLGVNNAAPRSRIFATTRGGGWAFSGTPRGAARAMHWSSSHRKFCARFPATGHSCLSPTGRSSTSKSIRSLPARAR